VNPALFPPFSSGPDEVADRSKAAASLFRVEVLSDAFGLQAEKIDASPPSPFILLRIGRDSRVLCLREEQEAISPPLSLLEERIIFRGSISAGHVFFFPSPFFPYPPRERTSSKDTRPSFHTDRGHRDSYPLLFPPCTLPPFSERGKESSSRAPKDPPFPLPSSHSPSLTEQIGVLQAFPLSVGQ